MALNSGCVVTHHSWDILPIPQNVIEQVTQLGIGQLTHMVFQDRTGMNIFDAVHDVHPDPSPSPPIEYDIPGMVDERVEIPGVDADIEAPTYDINDTNNENDFEIMPLRCPL